MQDLAIRSIINHDHFVANMSWDQASALVMSVHEAMVRQLNHDESVEAFGDIQQRDACLLEAYMDAIARPDKYITHASLSISPDGTGQVSGYSIRDDD